MRKGIHPKYAPLRIRIGSDELVTNSTLGAPEILMDVDFRLHPAWNRSATQMVNESNKNVSRFNDKFSGLFS